MNLQRGDEDPTPEHLRAVLASLPVAVCSRDRERRILYLNPCAEELTGYRTPEVQGKPCHSVFCHAGATPEPRCASDCPAQACLGEGRAVPPVVLSLRTRAGERLTTVARFTPLRGGDGEVVGFVETFAIQPAPERLGIDPERREVTLDQRPVHLTCTEFALLACLARQPGKAFSHTELLRSVWGPECEGQNQYLHTFVAQVRRKLEPDPRHPRYLITEPRYGYRLYLQPLG